MGISVSHYPATDVPNLSLDKKRWMLRGTAQKESIPYFSPNLLIFILSRKQKT